MSGLEPGYRALWRSGELTERAARAQALLRACVLCPRRCGVDRAGGERGACRSGARAEVASWGPHHGEEPPLSGWGGSGTIFFTGCSLRCVFCQNAGISQGPPGTPMDAPGLAEVMLLLQSGGCHNINVVTPTHFVPQTLEALGHAAAAGLRVPLVYNSSGYESVETLRLLDGVVDIYLPDLKYADADAGRRLSKVKDYPAVARAAVREMHRQVGDLRVGADGIATRGLLVRHLVLPDGLAGTAEVARFLAEISRETCLNVMGQYHPGHRAADYPEIDRRPTREELAAAVASARSAGLLRVSGW
ncbi:MAG: radical SAM protein [Armatimonadetes bacterium]|nr:radical SAM protein [Armatimonadota bacterium]